MAKKKGRDSILSDAVKEMKKSNNHTINRNSKSSN